MTNDERKYLLEETKRAQANGFEGSVLDVFRNPNILQEFQAQSVLQPTQGSNIQIASTPEEQQQGLRGVPANQMPDAMVFPNVKPNTSFNTVGMKAPIDINLYDDDKQGHLVKSYKNVPPGIANLPMGPQGGTVIETPAAQSGGRKKYQSGERLDYIEPKTVLRINTDKQGNAVNAETQYASKTTALDPKRFFNVWDNSPMYRQMMQGKEQDLNVLSPDSNHNTYTTAEYDRNRLGSLLSPNPFDYKEFTENNPLPKLKPGFEGLVEAAKERGATGKNITDFRNYNLQNLSFKTLPEYASNLSMAAMAPGRGDIMISSTLPENLVGPATVHELSHMQDMHIRDFNNPNNSIVSIGPRYGDDFRRIYRPEDFSNSYTLDSKISELGVPLMPRQDYKKIRDYSRANEGVMPESYGVSLPLSSSEGFTSEEEKKKIDFANYVTHPSETRARLNATRYEANKVAPNLWNPSYQHMTPEILNKLKRLIPEDKENLEFLNLRQLLQFYTDEQIIDMFNSISMNDDNTTSTNIQTAKYGGIKKYRLEGVRKYQSGNSKMSSITPTTVAPPKFDLNRFKKGVSYVESKDGKYMMNPNSSATGLYGQLYNEVKDLPELKNIDRNAFAADTALQNKILGLRVQGKIPGIPGIEKAAKDLYNEYSTQISNFPYDVTEVGALVNFLGRQGAREYLGYVLRDKKDLKTVFPNLYGESVAAPNKTPDEYIQEFRSRKRSGGPVKYQTGGPISYAPGGLTDRPRRRKKDQKAPITVSQPGPEWVRTGPGLMIDGKLYQSTELTGNTLIPTDPVTGEQIPILLPEATVYPQEDPITKALRRTGTGLLGSTIDKNEYNDVGDRIRDARNDFTLNALSATGDIMGKPQQYLINAPLALAMGQKPNLSMFPTADKLRGINNGPAYPSETFGITNPYGAFAVDFLTDPSIVFNAGVGLSRKLPAAGKYLTRQTPKQLPGSSVASSVDDVGRVLTQVPQIPKPSWQMQELPGLHLKSTMSDGPISKIVEPKTGLVNVEQALGIIGKESGGADKVALIKQGLGNNIPKKMDYNEFRKVVQDQLIPLETKINPRGASEYGLHSIGYEDAPPMDMGSVTFSNKAKFGRGSSAHNNPDETLGHAHFFRDAETPDVLTVTQIQSDAFQGTHRIMPKTQQEALEKVSKLKEEGVEIKSMFGDGKESSNSVLAHYEKNLQLDEASAKNFTQKQLLDKNHQERYLQELVDYAGKRGDVNKVRVPTSETAAKVQGYEIKKRWNINRLSNGDNVVLANGLEGTVIDDTFRNATTIATKDGKEIIVDMSTAGYGASKTPSVKFVNNTEVKEISTYSDKQLTILKKYSEQPKTIKKLFGAEPKVVTDSKGNTWYEFDIPKKFKEGKGEIKAFNWGVPAAIGAGAAAAVAGSEPKEIIPPKFRYGGPVKYQTGGLPGEMLYRSTSAGAPLAYDSPTANGYLLPDPNRPELMNTGATEYKMGVDNDLIPTVVNGMYFNPEDAYQRYRLTGEKFKPTADPSAYSKFYDEVNKLGIMKQKRSGGKKPKYKAPKMY